MAKLQLSLGLLANDRSRPIINGTVTPEGIDLVVTVAKSAGELFWRQLHFKEFDIAEMSFSDMLMLASRGDQSWVMLPVFMTRSFFHTGVLVRADAGIEQPSDLRGKRVGVNEYVQTAALWARGILKDEFGLRPEELDWHHERSENVSCSHFFGLDKPTKHFQYIPVDKNIGEMLVAGELDATIYYTGRSNWMDRSSLNLRKNPAVKSLFPKPHAEGLRYYQKTGIFPMNHSPVVRRSIVERHPWVILNLYQAFLTAKEQAAARMKEFAETYVKLGWLDPKAQTALNRDPLPYGIKSNRNALETCARYSYEEGLSPRLVAVEEIFAKATMEF